MSGSHNMLIDFLGGSSRIEDIREIQRARERKHGLTEIECAVGIGKVCCIANGSI